MGARRLRARPFLHLLMFWRFASRRGYQLLREGKWDAALTFFTGCCSRYPRVPDPFYEVGKLHFKKGDLAAARQSLLESLERSPGRDLITGILEMTNWWMISSPNFFNSHPRFSPDGKKLAFCSARRDTNGDGKIDGSDRAAIYVADLSTTHVSEVISNTFNNASPIWSPDGRYLLYFSSRPLGEGAAAIEDPKYQHLLMRDLENGQDTLLVPASLNPRYPTFTPDGRHVIVCTIDSAGGPSGISKVDVASQVRQSLTSHAFEHTYPQVSANGRWLMYVSWRGAARGAPVLDSNPAIYLMNLETLKETVLVSDQFSNAYPQFSPQSDAIVFLSRRRDTNTDGKIDRLDNFGVYTLRLSDRKERCIVSDAHYSKFPGWSPDGKWLLFLTHWIAPGAKAAWRGEDYFEFKGLYRVPSSGGKPEAVVSDKFFGSRFCDVSPAGSLAAYVSWRPATSRGLYIADYLKLPSLEQLRGFVQNNLS
jgi:Tol biopolymer transport system component